MPMMKLALMVLFVFLLCASDSLETDNVSDEIIIAVTVKDETIEWQLNFGSEKTNSCFLSGDVRRGTSTNTTSQEVMSIAYIRTNETLVIESPAGLCDAGVETNLTLINGSYEGDLYERSFYGYEVIGFVKEVKR